MRSHVQVDKSMENFQFIAQFLINRVFVNTHAFVGEPVY